MLFGLRWACRPALWPLISHRDSGGHNPKTINVSQQLLVLGRGQGTYSTVSQAGSGLELWSPAQSFRMGLKGRRQH